MSAASKDKVMYSCAMHGVQDGDHASVMKILDPLGPRNGPPNISDSMKHLDPL